MLTRRNIARIIAAISAALLAFHTATAALSPSDEALSRKASAAMVRALNIEDSMPSGDSRIAVSDHAFAELAEVFFAFRHLITGQTAQPCAIAAQGRRYATRKTLTVPFAARITGLSESTIKRLDKDPKNTNYPGRNATRQMLAAWARLYRGDKIAAREVRSANRPSLGLDRS